MEIYFATSRLKKLCESSSKLRQAHGATCASRIAQRLSDMRAAEHLGEFRALPGRCHALTGERAGQVALHLPDGKRLVFEPAGEPAGQEEVEVLVWENVTAVRVLEIVDYH